MKRIEDWRYEQVPRLGTVILTPEALGKLDIDHVGPDKVAEVLEYGTDSKAPSGSPVAGYREYGGVRLEFKTWRHMPGAAVVCVNGYRVGEL